MTERIDALNFLITIIKPQPVTKAPERESIIQVIGNDLRALVGK